MSAKLGNVLQLLIVVSRRDPSPLSLSSILNTIEGIFGLGSSSSGSGGSLLSRDDALEL